jgi:arabinan endo-1,5-alpha-L-arabinosidase
MKSLVTTLTFVLVAYVAGTVGFAQTAADAPASASLLQTASRGVRVHDPSTIVKCKDEYWVFYTGRGIPSYHSKDLITWQPGPHVFSNAPPWVAQAVPRDFGVLDFWAPDIIRIGDRYLLYFSASRFGRNTSAIGLATNPTLDPADPEYHWTDQGEVIRSGTQDDFNTIDPSVVRDKDGRLWLAFGSFWSGIKMIELNPATGKIVSSGSPIYSLARYDAIEASCLYSHGGYYYLFVDWGMCCRGTNSTYSIHVGRSPNITGPYLDKSGLDMMLGGGSIVLGTSGAFIGPGHAGIISAGGTNWLSCHFYDGTHRGMPTLALLPLSWTIDGWPEVEPAPVQPVFSNNNPHLKNE